MKKYIVFFIVLLSFIFIKPSKSFACINCHRTIVRGRIVDADRHPVSQAQVAVVCNHEGQSNTLNTTSNNIGFYLVTFTPNKCDEGDLVTVTASKDGQTGSNTGIVRDGFCDRDIAVIRVILVPEFGLITGTLATVGSIGAFLALKRKAI